MKPRHRLFVLTIITFTFCGCKSNTTQVTTLPPADNVDSNTLPNEPTNNGKQKLLDMALKMSGSKLPPGKRGKVLRMLSLNEKDVIRGLGVWLELLDGEYPNSLDPKVALKQAEALWRAKHGGVSPEKTTDKEKK
ncbi:MAG: hypothetical protein ACYSWZ_17225, partial [Planctomycetota bacterium]